MDKSIRVAVILTAMDRMSSVMTSAVMKSQQRMAALSKMSFGISRAAAVTATATAGLMAAPVKAYADLEDASLRLKAVMLQDGGRINAKMFKALNDQAILLGNKLPGTTADFQNLYATLLQQGTPANAILEGTGKAAAYLAVQLKMPSEQAAILAARMRMQMGIADRDMMQFMDVMARIKNVGVDPTEMQYAFSRSAGAMKLLNVQGLEASKTLGTLYAMLLREGGATGETAGTGVSRIMSEIMNPTKVAKFNAMARSMGMSFEFFRNGKYLGIENFIEQLNKFGGMDPERITKLLTPLTGGEGTDNQFTAALSKMGVGGFNKMSAEMASHATMIRQVDMQLGSLTNKWEAASGTAQNAMAAFGEAMAPMLKGMADWINEVSIKTQIWIQQHPVISKWLGVILGGIVAVTGSIAVLGFGIGAVSSGWVNMIRVVSLLRPALFAISMMMEKAAFMVLRTVIPAMISFTSTVWANAAAWMANPMTWIILAVIAAIAALVAAGWWLYKNWDKVLAWFRTGWAILKASVVGNIAVLMMFWDVIKGIGKTMVGVFTFDTQKAMAGINETAAAVAKFQNGGIKKTFMTAVNASLKDSGVLQNQGARPVAISKPIAKSSNRAVTINNHYSPTIQVPAGSDGKSLNKNLHSQWEKWQKEKTHKNTRLGLD